MLLHLHQAVVPDDEAGLGGGLGVGDVVDDELAQLELAADPHQQDAEQHQVDEQQPAEAQEGQGPVPGDQAELAEDRQQRSGGERGEGHEGEEPRPPQRRDQALAVDVEHVRDAHRGDHAPGYGMLERPHRPGHAEAVVEVALPRRHGEDVLGDRPQRVEAGEHLEDGEGRQDREDDGEIAEVVLVIDPVADQGAADEIAAGELDEHDRRARNPRHAVVHRDRQEHPEEAREDQEIDGGRASAAIDEPAPDEERKQREQQHPVGRQHGPGDREGSGNHQQHDEQEQEARGGGLHRGPGRTGLGDGVRGGRQCTHAGRLQLFNHTIPFQNDPKPNRSIPRSAPHPSARLHSTETLSPAKPYRHSGTRSIGSFRDGVPGCQAADGARRYRGRRWPASPGKVLPGPAGSMPTRPRPAPALRRTGARPDVQLTDPAFPLRMGARLLAV